MNYAVMRILVITEGKLRTDRSSDGIGAMLDAVECWRSELGSDLFRVTRVQINEDDTRFNLLYEIQKGGYDQIWFFGSGSPTHEEFPRRSLNEHELDALRVFMDAGGGVFATGDHEDVGASLCAAIPRVRHMRSWGVGGFTPSKNDRSRVDTVFASRINGDSDSEQDTVGKPIWVKCSEGQPHPLLQGTPPDTALSDGPIGPVRAPPPSIIRWLPDHMHEGECRVLPEGFDAEIRADFKEGAQTEIVAWSVKRGFSDAMGLTEDKPSLHSVVCCYDGRRDNVGRVVVDSTFHHWVQDNTSAMRDSPNGRDLDRYPVNIAQWLSKAMNDMSKRVALVYALGKHRDVDSVRKQKSYGLTEQQYNKILGETAETVWAASGMSVLVLREILDEMRDAEKLPVSSGGTLPAAEGAYIAEPIATENRLPAVAKPYIAYSAVPVPESAEELVAVDDAVEAPEDGGESAEILPEADLAAESPPKPAIPYESQENTVSAKIWERTGKRLDSFLGSSEKPVDPG